MNKTRTIKITLSDLINRRYFNYNPNDFPKNDEICGDIFAALFYESYKRQRPLLLSYLILLRLVNKTKVKDLPKEQLKKQLEYLNDFTTAFCLEYGWIPFNEKRLSNKHELEKKFTTFWNHSLYDLKIKNNIADIFNLAMNDFKILLSAWNKRKTQMALVYSEKSISIILGDMTQIAKGYEDWKKIRQGGIVSGSR